MTKTVLCFGAHPDDIEIGCGGSVAKLVNQGYQCTFAVMTSGEAGDAKIPAADLGKIREKEAVAAARKLGAKDVSFMRLPDGLTAATFDAKIALINLIRDVKPEIIFTHASNDSFNDHRIVHLLTMAAIGAAAGPWFQQSRGAPYATPNVYGYEVWHPLTTYQLAVDITATLATKLEALREHQSQVATVPYDRAVEGLANYRGALTMQGKYVEVFEVLKATTHFSH